MRFKVACDLNYEAREQATLLLNIEAPGSERQVVHASSFTITPPIQHEVFQMPETGNIYRRFALAPGRYDIAYTAEVETRPSIESPEGVPETPVAALPFDVVPHLYPSRYCQSDQLARFAWREFGRLPQGHQRVTAICNWIYQNVDYLAGTSDSGTSAYDTFSTRAGVCRDFAHLGVTFCRALGIPARFVSAFGWQLEPPDFHAVFEAYLGRRWYLFDATRLGPIDGLVRIGVGRDAADTAFSTFYGVVNAGPMRVSIAPAGDGDTSRSWTTEAVSLADR